jgi:DNA-binding transcriptional LysR family regulator
MELRLLEALVAVADQLHFGKAAAQLGIAQPPLSQRIQRLERELGVRLFDRDRHGVALTSAGVEIADQARRVLAHTAYLTRLADGIRSGTRGTLTLGAVGSAFYAALPTLLAPCRAQLPELALRISEMETPQLVEALRAGDLDVGFLRPPVDHGLRTRTVWAEPLVVAVPHGHRLAAEPAVRVGQLADEPIVLFPRASGPGYWDEVNSLLRTADLTLEPVAEADHVTTVLGLVALGVGLSIVPASAQVLALTGVCYRPLTTATQLALDVAVNPDTLSPAIRRFLHTLPDQPSHAGELSSPSPPRRDLST